MTIKIAFNKWNYDIIKSSQVRDKINNIDQAREFPKNPICESQNLLNK